MHGYILGTTTNRMNRHWQSGSGNSLPHTIARGSRLAGVIDPQDGTFYNLPYAFGYPGFSGVIDNPHNYYIEMKQLSFVYGVKFKYSDHGRNITKCVQIWKTANNATLESRKAFFSNLTKFNFNMYHEFDRNGNIVKKDDKSVGFDAGKPIKRDIITQINNTEYVFIEFWYKTGGERELPPEIIAKIGKCEEINPEDKGDAVFNDASSDSDLPYTYKYESRRITSWVRKWLGTIPEFSLDYEGRTLKAVYAKEADTSDSSFSMTGVMTDAAASAIPSEGNKLSDFSGTFGYLDALKLFISIVHSAFGGIQDLFAHATCYTTAWYTAGQPRPMIGNEAHLGDFARIQKSWWGDKAAMLVGATGVPTSVKQLGKDVVIIQGKDG